jgi:DNA topoisomerase VI subunit B
MRTPALGGGRGRQLAAGRAGADNSDTPSVPAQLDRTTFAISRAAEFLELRALQSQTGQPAHRFGDVIVKELMDNALDAAESAGVAPRIRIGTEIDGDELCITVADNGPGLAPELLARVLDFTVLVSDKAAYRSPTRGLQGNALKTGVETGELAYSTVVSSCVIT